MYRALHFSDVHVDVPTSVFPIAQMFNKRLVGAANLVLRRRSRFIESRRKLAALAEFAAMQRVDALLCTGDYTVLGTEPEYVAARQAIAGLLALDAAYVTVPGNHDVYMPDTIADGRFERHFGDLLENDMPELAGPAGWPRVRMLGDHAAAVCVNSARPNPQVWRSSGRVADGEIASLADVLGDPRLAGRFIFLLTHYAPRRPDGSADTPLHGLENADTLLATCRGHVHALLHGHIHHRFSLNADGVWLFGAGSATDRGREGLWLFELDGTHARAIPGRWAGDRYELESAGAVAIA